MELDKTRIEDAIVREVADNLMHENELRERVKNAAAKRIDEMFKTVAEAQISAAVESAIKSGFDHEYSRVNTFGQREGELTTIRKELERVIAGYWNEKVDRQGNPSNGYGSDITRAEWTMMQIVAASFKDDMKQHVINLGGALKDGLRAELHKTVNSLLSEVFHVKSLDDGKIGHSGGVGRAIIDPEQKKVGI